MARKQAMPREKPRWGRRPALRTCSCLERESTTGASASPASGFWFPSNRRPVERMSTRCRAAHRPEPVQGGFPYNRDGYRLGNSAVPARSCPAGNYAGKSPPDRCRHARTTRDQKPQFRNVRDKIVAFYPGRVAGLRTPENCRVRSRILALNGAGGAAGRGAEVAAG